MVKRITRPLTMLALAASLGLGALAAQANPPRATRRLRRMRCIAATTSVASRCRVAC